MENGKNKSVELINKLIKKVETRKIHERINDIVFGMSDTEKEFLKDKDLDFGDFQIEKGEILSILKFAKRKEIDDKFNNFLK